MNETTWDAPQRVSAWRSLLDYFRGDDFHGEVRSAAVLSAFAVLGAAGFLLARQADWLDDRDHLRYEFGADAYILARDTHEQFAQGIPRNLAYLDEITRMQLALENHFATVHAGGAKSSRSCDMWPAGPTCRDWDQELRERKLEWAREVQHYAALCEEAAVVFEHVTPAWIREQAIARGRAAPQLDGPGARQPARTPADVPTEAAYIRAQMDLMNSLSGSDIDENDAEFTQLVAERGGARPDPPAADDGNARAQWLQRAIYDEVDAAFSRCLRELDYGLQFHETLRDYGLVDGRKEN